MTNMNEEVTRVSMECSMSEMIHSAPSSLILFCLNAHTVDDDDSSAEQKWCDKPEVNVFVQKYPHETI